MVLSCPYPVHCVHNRVVSAASFPDLMTTPANLGTVQAPWYLLQVGKGSTLDRGFNFACMKNTMPVVSVCLAAGIRMMVIIPGNSPENQLIIGFMEEKRGSFHFSA